MKSTIWTLVGVSLWLCLWVLSSGCAYMQNSESPKASASISDTCTSATVSMGPVGEFSLIATHCKTTDGATTGTVIITGSKNTMNNMLTGAIGAAAGYLAGAGM